MNSFYLTNEPSVSIEETMELTKFVIKFLLALKHTSVIEFLIDLYKSWNVRCFNDELDGDAIFSVCNVY